MDIYNAYGNGKLDYAMMRDRIKREDGRIKKLRATYPYGLKIDVEGLY